MENWVFEGMQWRSPKSGTCGLQDSTKQVPDVQDHDRHLEARCALRDMPTEYQVVLFHIQVMPPTLSSHISLCTDAVIACCQLTNSIQQRQMVWSDCHEDMGYSLRMTDRAQGSGLLIDHLESKKRDHKQP